MRVGDGYVGEGGVELQNAERGGGARVGGGTWRTDEETDGAGSKQLDRRGEDSAFESNSEVLAVVCEGVSGAGEGEGGRGAQMETLAQGQLTTHSLPSPSRSLILKIDLEDTMSSVIADGVVEVWRGV